MSNADAIYERLASDFAVLENVGTYIGQPSIFLGDVVGSQVKVSEHGPYIIVRDSSVTDEDTGINLRRQVHRVFVYGEPSQAVDILANHARRVLHRMSAQTANGPIIGSNASGPIDAPTSDPSLVGRVITISFLKQE